MPPDIASTFTGWSEACTTNPCIITMDLGKSVTATFTAAPKAKVGSKGFTTVQSAYNDASTTDNAVIKLLEGTLPGTFTADREITVTLEGGYDVHYGFINSQTTIQSQLV